MSREKKEITFQEAAAIMRDRGFSLAEQELTHFFYSKKRKTNEERIDALVNNLLWIEKKYFDDF